MITKGKAYILRQCAPDMTSHRGFKWPESGEVSAPDWKATAGCGNGLHGFLWGEGDGSLANYSPKNKWLVAEIDEWIDLGGKVKSPRANVVFCGTMHDAAAEIRRLGARGAVIGSTNTGGNRSTNTGGFRSTNTVGDYSANTGGDYSKNFGGDHSTNTGGFRSTNTGGIGSTNTGGIGSILQWRVWDGERDRMLTAYVGEDGIKHNVAYTNDGMKIVRAK
jgi:hypothetical protein